MNQTISKLCLKTLGVLPLAIAVFLLSAIPSHAWWDKEWTIRKHIVIDTTGTGGAISETIGNTPVLLRLHEGMFQFDAAKQDGSDIRILAGDEKTQVSYHIEKFDPLFYEAFVWVKGSDLKTSSQTGLWLYYGNGGPKAAPAEDAKGTYDEETVLVYHFSEGGAPAKDFTKNSNNAQTAGTAVEGALIGGGVRFDGQNGITVPGSPTLQWTSGGPVSWSAWIKPVGPQKNAVILSRMNGSAHCVIGLNEGKPFVEVSDGATTTRSPEMQPIGAFGLWHHLGVVAANGSITVYLDGERYSSVVAMTPALDTPLVVGNLVPDGAEQAALGDFDGTGYTGELDEMIISKTARSAGYMKIASQSQGGGERADKLIAIGADEQTHSLLSDGYIGVIIASLTADGWVVIGLLGVMGIISWWVMITKAGYLNTGKKGNKRFLKEWSHIASDLAALDQGDAESAKSLGGRVDAKQQQALKKSSVYRIYHIGVEEIQHRLREDGASRALSARSIQAIRATLDGGLVRETQRLNSGMVLLTIAISGGPFLGLLGTVVGVMITFAAVAAAGDVNVNAIAPGIAAALAATVAGLGVAIPSLFGYNYLLTRVKEATSDMHVFIDEFVTKMAEYYCEPSEGTRAAVDVH